MRILHVITTLITGGAERLMVDLLPMLRDKGDEVDLLLFDGTRTPFREELENKGVTIFELTNERGITGHADVYNLSNITKLRRYLKGYDIIHTHNTACQVYVPLAKKLYGIPATLVTTEHSSNSRRRTKWWFKPIDHWVYNQYSAIVCISDRARLNLEDYYRDKETITTINNGVAVSRFIKPIKNIENKKEFLLTMVAALRVEKDHETLLKAMTLLPDCYHLQIVGGGPRETVLKDLCESLGLNKKVDFLGMRQDIPEILEQSDINILSSHWEGLSLSSVEGMASGRPFIASDVDGLREIVSGAGILFPHGDEAALAKEIQNLCENPDLYRETAIACQERSKQFDISVMAEGYHQLYQSLMEGKS